MDNDMKDAGAGKALEATSRKLDHKAHSDDTDGPDMGAEASGQQPAPTSVEDAIEMAQDTNAADAQDEDTETPIKADDPTPV